MRPQLGACPGSAGVGSLWVSTETGVRPEEAPPTSHRPRENFRPQRGPQQSLSVLAPWPCPSWVQNSNSLPLPTPQSHAHRVRIKLAKAGEPHSTGKALTPMNSFRTQTRLVWEKAVLFPPEGSGEEMSALTKESWPLASLKCNTKGVASWGQTPEYLGQRESGDWMSSPECEPTASHPSLPFPKAALS